MEPSPPYMLRKLYIVEVAVTCWPQSEHLQSSTHISVSCYYQSCHMMETHSQSPSLGDNSDSAMAVTAKPQSPISHDGSAYESCNESDSDAPDNKSSSRSANDASSDGLPDELIAGFDTHLSLIARNPAGQDADEINAAPLFTGSVWRLSNKHRTGRVLPATQYGLLGGSSIDMFGPDADRTVDPRIFHNVTAPSSVFICGSQGSGKSHTLSCLLENCLIPSNAGVLPRPLTGVVFHYDTFSSDTGGSPCEAAYLSSSPDVAVGVLCAPTNVQTIKVRLG